MDLKFSSSQNWPCSENSKNRLKNAEADFELIAEASAVMQIALIALTESSPENDCFHKSSKKSFKNRTKEKCFMSI